MSCSGLKPTRNVVPSDESCNPVVSPNNVPAANDAVPAKIGSGSSTSSGSCKVITGPILVSVCAKTSPAK